jgi:transcriptional regulator of acetoin/glycerol metabolism
VGAPIAAGNDRLPSLAEAERTHIVRVLEATQWNKKEAARVLDISRGTLYRKIVEYALEPESRATARKGRDAEA